MNILLAPNNYYVMPTMVLLQSLFETAQEQLDIYVLHSGLLPENIQKLDDFVTRRTNIVKQLNNQGMLYGQFQAAEAFYKK